MNRLAHHFTTMAYNNAWANHRLLSAVEHLKHDEFVAPRVGFFPSLEATLNHILVVDWYYVDALERSLRDAPPNTNAHAFFDPPKPFGTPRALHVAQRAVDRRLIEVCLHLTDDRLDTPIEIVRRSGVEKESATRLLAHLFQHQIHHRGQAHAMLSSTSVPPPQLDEFFFGNEAHLRVDDFAELGFSEEEIWKAR